MLVHDFGKKLEIFFLLCFSGQIGSLKVFHDVLDRKLAFLHLDDKNREFKKGQQFAISWQKLDIFLKFTVSEIK